MGGGKDTVTQTQLDVVDMFKDDNELYVKEMLRLFAILKTISARIYGQALVESANKYFNGDRFEALGGAVKNTASINVASKTAVTKWYRGIGGNKYSFPMVFVTQDSDNLSCAFQAKKLKDTLGQTYPTRTDDTKTFTYTRRFDSDDSPGSGKTYYIKETSGDDQYPYVWLNNSKIGSSYDDGNTCTFTPYHSDESHTFSYTLPSYEINGDWYLLQSDTVTNHEVTMELVSDPTQTIQVHVATDTRQVFIAKFVTGLIYPEFVSCGIGYTGASGYYALFKSDFLGEFYDANFLMYPMKHNFNFIDHEGYVEALGADLGINNGDMEATLSQSEIKSALITYAAKRTNPTYKEALDAVYGTGNNVTFNSSYFNLSYSSGVDYNDSFYYNVTYDGVTQDVSYIDKKAFIVPIDFITENFGTRQKYDELDNLMSMFVAQSVTTELEWYQTVWFKLVSLIVAAVLAPFTFGVSFFLYVGGQIVNGMIEMGYITGRWGIVLQTIMGILSLFVGDFSWISTGVLIFQTAAQVASQIFIVEKMEELQEEITESVEETNRIRESIAAIQENMLYIPFDKYDTAFNTLYDLPYNAYSAMNTGIYNYDNKFKTTGRLV